MRDQPEPTKHYIVKCKPGAEQMAGHIYYTIAPKYSGRHVLFVQVGSDARLVADTIASCLEGSVGAFAYIDGESTSRERNDALSGFNETGVDPLKYEPGPRYLVWCSNELPAAQEVKVLVYFPDWLMDAESYVTRINELKPSAVFYLAPTEEAIAKWKALASQLGIDMEAADLTTRRGTLLFCVGRPFRIKNHPGGPIWVTDLKE